MARGVSQLSVAPVPPPVCVDMTATSDVIAPGP